MESDQKPIIFLLCAFILIWGIGEIRSNLELSKFEREILEFRNKGERFTASDGQALEARVEALEELCGN